SKLHDSGRSRHKERSEVGRVGKILHGWRGHKVWVIEHVIKIGPELSTCEIRKPNRPQKRHIDVLDAGTGDYVSSAVAERFGLRNAEGRGIKKPGRRRVGNFRVANEVGTIHDWTPGSSDVLSQHGRQRHARLEGTDGLNLPTIDETPRRQITDGRK